MKGIDICIVLFCLFCCSKGGDFIYTCADCYFLRKKRKMASEVHFFLVLGCLDTSLSSVSVSLEESIGSCPRSGCGGGGNGTWKTSPPPPVVALCCTCIS